MPIRYGGKQNEMPRLLWMLKGQTETITATLTEGVSGTITWESSNTNVATVANGTITATGKVGFLLLSL